MLRPAGAQRPRESTTESTTDGVTAGWTGPDLVVGVDSNVPQRTRRLLLRICIACSAAHTVTAECAATREGLRFASANRRRRYRCIRRYRCMGATWGGLQRSEVLTEWSLTAGSGTMAWALTGAIPVCLCSSATRDRADSHRPSGHQC